MSKLENKRIAILATDGFEQSELDSPLERLKKEGAKVDVVSLSGKEKIKGWDKDKWGSEVNVDRTLNEAKSEDYDGLMLPGGVINPDQLRQDEEAVRFVQGFFKEEKNKPVAAICHAPLMLIEAEVTKDKSMTSYPSIKKDLMNSGAKWTDEEVVVDNGLVTSRSPKDMEPFLNKMVEEFREGAHRV